MKTLKSRLLNEGFYKNAGGMSHPATTEELLDEIQIRLDRGQTNLNDIDTSKITNMNYVFFRFRDNYNLENIDISKWDTSNVTDMGYMFYKCSNFNSDLSNWNTSKVEYMSDMFCGCENFNSDLSRWNVSKVRDMTSMFR